MSISRPTYPHSGVVRSRLTTCSDAGASCGAYSNQVRKSKGSPRSRPWCNSRATAGRYSSPVSMCCAGYSAGERMPRREQPPFTGGRPRAHPRARGLSVYPSLSQLGESAPAHVDRPGIDRGVGGHQSGRLQARVHAKLAEEVLHVRVGGTRVHTTPIGHLFGFQPIIYSATPLTPTPLHTFETPPFHIPYTTISLLTL